MMRILLALSLSMVATAAVSEERSPRISIAPGALICDTLEQALQVIDTQGTETVDGCGYLQSPMWVEMVPLEPYQANEQEYRMVQFKFPMMTSLGVQWWTQYGFWGEPQILDTSL